MLAALCPKAQAETQPDVMQVAERHFRTGEQFFRAGKLEAAIIEFEAAYQHSREPDLIYNLCLAYRRLSEQPDRQAPELDKQRSKQYCDQFCLVRVTDPSCATQKLVVAETPGPARPVTATKAPRNLLLGLTLAGSVLAASALASGITAGTSAQQYNAGGGLPFFEAGEPFRERYFQASAASGVLSAAALVVLSIDLVVWQRQKRQPKIP